MGQISSFILIESNRNYLIELMLCILWGKFQVLSLLKLMEIAPYNQAQVCYGVDSKIHLIQTNRLLPHRIEFSYVMWQGCTIGVRNFVYGTDTSLFQFKSEKICTIRTRNLVYGTDISLFQFKSEKICTIRVRNFKYGTYMSLFQLKPE